MRRGTKHSRLIRLSRGAAQFFPSLANHFICPTCLAAIALPGNGLITQAHIIPQAAGGSRKTLLCRTCNSTFGARQDKWFGEAARIKSERRDVLQTAMKEGFFELNGQRVYGRWNFEAHEGFKFIHEVHRNPPSVNRALDEYFSQRPPRLSITVGIPLLKRQSLVDVGLLTAGYLLWFAAAGYSWVFQMHLDSVRKQILNPDKLVLPNYGVAYAPTVISEEPQLGLMRLGAVLAMVMTYHNGIAIFPPAGHPQLYDTFASGFESVPVSTFWRLQPRRGTSEFRCSYAIEDQIFIYPDKGEHCEVSPGGDFLLLFDPALPGPRMLPRSTVEEFANSRRGA